MDLQKAAANKLLKGKESKKVPGGVTENGYYTTSHGRRGKGAAPMFRANTANNTPKLPYKGPHKGDDIKRGA